MINVSGDRWEADIPERSVQEPGVEYYILASDGQLQSTSPSVCPEGGPYSIAVLPNEPPSIDHTPVQFTSSGEPLTLEASAADNTDQVSTVDLLYRSAGENPSYTVLAMQEEGGIYSTTIPGSDVSKQGLEYFVRATDNFGVSATKGTADQPFEVAVIPLNITPAQTPRFLSGGVISPSRRLSRKPLRRQKPLVSITGNWEGRSSNQPPSKR